jgi:hypothetical protein
MIYNNVVAKPMSYAPSIELADPLASNVPSGSEMRSNKKTGSIMQITLATGCAHSGWDAVLPLLQADGVSSGLAAFVGWHDKLFGRQDEASAFEVHEPRRPDDTLRGEAGSIAGALTDSPAILADYRCVWVLDFWAEQLPQARFLLLVTRAETALAHALARGLAAPAYLESWLATNRQLLHFQRRHRKRTLMLDAEAAVRNPDAFVAACTQFGIALPERDSLPAVQPASLALERLLACHVVGAYDAASELEQELEASALPLDTAIPALVGSADAVQAYSELRRRALDLESELVAAISARDGLDSVRAELEQENDSLLAQLRQVQEELESLCPNCDKLPRAQKEQERLRAEVVKTNDTCKELEQAHEELKQENELLLLQLHQVQEELERYFLKYQELSQKQVADKAPPVPAPAPEAAKAGHGGHRANGAKPRTRRPAAVRAVGSWLAVRKKVKLLKRSGLFDEAWYLAQYPDVAKAGANPIEHYIVHGAEEGRNPSPTFDTRFYLNHYPDVAAAGFNPLVHYVMHGRGEGRRTSWSA